MPEAFGLSKSSISRRFVRVSEKKLKALLHRRLDAHEFVALVLDGKTLRHAQMGIALGLTKAGEKMILGFLECASENQRVVSKFLEHLIARGPPVLLNQLISLDFGRSFPPLKCHLLDDSARLGAEPAFLW